MSGFTVVSVIEEYSGPKGRVKIWLVPGKFADRFDEPEYYEMPGAIQLGPVYSSETANLVTEAVKGALMAAGHEVHEKGLAD